MEVAAMSREHQDRSQRVVLAALAATVVLYILWQVGGLMLMSDGSPAPAHAAAAHADDSHDSAAHAIAPAAYSIIPFACLLLCIALCPLFHATEHWWERNSSKFKVASAFAALTLIYYGLLYGHGVVDHMTHETTAAGLPTAIAVLKNAILVEYIPFITLLFSLYVVSGGVTVEGHLVGRPALNTTIIGIGGLIASFVGTTGAAMLLIRPLLKANARREYVAHTVIFFIFVVCNTGGCLLPIGDPPLFLGFLRGVPFTWTMNLWVEWLFVNLALLAVYFVWDSIRYRREKREHVEAAPEHHEPFAIRGVLNFAWLGGIILAVALLDPSKTLPGTEWHPPLYLREIVMLTLAAFSLLLTSVENRVKNSFSYEAILEVAALFVGIFICMQAPIQILNVHGAALGITSPMQFFWATGTLSSFLDNAPTYVVFFETAKVLPSSGTLVAGVEELALSAISLGAVFMGAMTYIGNGPNFMVKAIAEKNNVRMPSFFGYMAYSCVVLLPLLVVMSLIFFRS